MNARVLGPGDGEILGLPEAVTDRFMISGKESGGGFALVEHVLHLVPWPRRCTAIAGRTSTAMCWRAGWVRCSVTRRSSARPAI